MFIVLPYLGNLSLVLRTRLQSSINKNLRYCKIKFIFKSTKRLSNFFHFKVPFNLHSNAVYKFLRGRCNATHFNVRIGEHSGVSSGKKLKSKITTAVKNHMFCCDHLVSLKDLKNLASSNSELHLRIKGSLLISSNKPLFI